METRKTLYPICFAVVMLCLLDVSVWAGRSTSRVVAPEGWPEQVGNRKLYA